jgi:hypothetical protein
MYVLPLMAAITIHRRSGRGFFQMARAALNPKMSADQGEMGQAMIEINLQPRRNGVTFVAILSEGPLMNILFQVTGSTGAGRGLQVCNGSRPLMASPTGDIHMATAQAEGPGVVVETGAIGVYAIMAIGALRTEIQLMGGGEDEVVTKMAGDAGLPLELSQRLTVAILTQEFAPIRIGHVGDEVIAEFCVRIEVGLEKGQRGGLTPVLRVTIAAIGGI